MLASCASTVEFVIVTLSPIVTKKLWQALILLLTESTFSPILQPELRRDSTLFFGLAKILLNLFNMRLSLYRFALSNRISAPKFFPGHTAVPFSPRAVPHGHAGKAA